MNSKLVILLFLTSVCTSLIGFADDFSGIITKIHQGKKSKTMTLMDNKTQLRLTLEYGSAEIEQQVSKLRLNDFISFDGELQPDKNTVMIRSIDYVGIYNLIGLWQGDDQNCYEFLSFTELNIFDQSLLGSNCQAFRPRTQHKSLTYTINPSSSSDWFALFSDDTISFGADIFIQSKKHIEITIYDSETGATTKVVKLNKIQRTNTSE